MRSTRTQIIAVGPSAVSGAVFRSRRQRELIMEATIVEPHGDCAKSTIARLTEKLGLVGRVHFVLPGYSTLTKIVKTPVIGKTRLARVAAFEASQNIPPAMGEIVWDYAELGTEGDYLELMIVAAKAERIAEWCDAAGDSGLSVAAISPASTALLRGFEFAHPSSGGAVLLNIGQRSTEFVLADRTRRYFRTLAISTTSTDATLHHSTEIETWAANGFAKKLSFDVARTIAHLRSQTALMPSAIHVCGDPALIMAVTAELEQNLKLPVVRYNPASALTCVGPHCNDASLAQHPHLAELVGAAAAGLSTRAASLGINLLPQRAKEFEFTAQRRVYWLIAAAAAVLGLIVPAAHYHRVARRTETELGAIRRIVSDAKLQAQTNARNLERLAEVQRSISKYDRLAAARTGWVRFLADLHGRISVVDGVWLEKLDVPVAPPIAQPAEVGRPLPSPAVRVVLSGWLVNQPGVAAATEAEPIQAILASLARSPYVSAIENEHFDSSTPGVLRFGLTIVASGAANL